MAALLLAARPVRRRPQSGNHGHRNVPVPAVRPGTGQVCYVEQGTSRDDEVNLPQVGANDGYDRDGPAAATTRARP
jgi:glucose/arabinose dehydrogenase